MVATEDAFNHNIAAAGEGYHVIAWVASWCRKCIYLKPKLAKFVLAYKSDPPLPIMYVDVNSIPSKVVKKASIKKLPTIQVWKGDQLKAQVIGAGKADEVLKLVGEMLDEETM